MSPPFRRVLIANRGVAAVRIARTLRRLGIEVVAVHSEADAALPHVTEADIAVPVGPAPAAESYLRIEALVDAARRSGADAVHPGYGFLSENPAFAADIRAAGLAFIGPEVRHVAEMGDKVTARRMMAAAGIPLLPAGEGPAEDADMAAVGARVGYPLLVKAAAGGGGMGMQKVASADTLPAAIGRARDFARRVFGDASVYLELWVEPARHVEFQMLGDGSGAVASLHERDCSTQRRHQKVIEEAPAPRRPTGAVEAMAERLRSVLADWRYASLGTVEMLMDEAGGFYFLEVNTRLQVEHAVTEAVTGLDLVELQVRQAAGERLDTLLPVVPAMRGHAIEVRIYAEDPVRFLPSPGLLTAFRLPEADGVRVDAGYREGNAVTRFYDPMLATVIAHGADRADAIARLDAALAGFEIAGVATNIPFLRRMLGSEEFVAARHHTTLAETVARRALRPAGGG